MFKGLSLLLQLLRYESGKKDNADLIAKIVLHFTGRSQDKQIYAWAETTTGQRYLAGESILDNINSFRDRDENTLGHKYLKFMDKYYFDALRDCLDLDKNGNTGNDVKKAYGRFIMDTHDFLHVITGYPPDTFGELMRIKIYKKYEGRGWAVVDWISPLWVLTGNITGVKRYLKLAREARQIRKTAKNYMEENWFEMLGWHINKVRKNLSTNSTILHNYENDYSSKISS
jgi:ubiquinone biosynthesis protein Coq4